MRSVAIMCMLVLAVGCSGGKYYQSWPMESEINGEKFHYHNAVQLNLPVTMFHATNSETWMEYCKTKLDDPQTEEQFLYPFQDCVREDKYQLSTMGSAASQFVTPVLSTSIQAGGLVGMGYFIGQGLGNSGSTIPQQGGGAQAKAQGGKSTSDSSSSSMSHATGGKASNEVNSGNHTTNVHPTMNINSNNSIKVK